MIKKIKVHAGSSKEDVKEIDNKLEIWVKKISINGKANEEVVRVLKKYFGKPVRILSGLSSRKKIIEVEDEI